jgi:hypothetical protein
MNQHALDVGGRGRPRNKHRIARRLEPRIAIGVVQVSDDVGRVEQSDEVLRKIRKGIDL